MDYRATGYSAAHESEQNGLLRAFSLEDYASLLPQLRPIRLTTKQILVDADVPIDAVYFPREGICSVISGDDGATPIEVATVGHEGFIGIPLLLGATSTPYRTVTQVEGHAWRLGADALREIVAQRPAVRTVLLRYAQFYTDQISQSVACNRLHTVEQRCARWLLITHDRVEGDSFELTHEFLAMMLGVRRAGVTVAIGALQAQGVVRSTRGAITITDRAGLERHACGCYAITRRRREELLGPM